MRYQGVILDIDGVLAALPHEQAWREALARLMMGEWLPIQPDIHYNPQAFTRERYRALVDGQSPERVAQALLDVFHIPDPDGSRATLYRAQKDAMLEELVQRGEFTVYPDTLRFLLRMKDQGLKLAAASSSPHAGAVLGGVDVSAFVEGGGLMGEALGIALPTGVSLLDMLDADVGGSPASAGAADLASAASRLLGIPPERCLALADPAGAAAARAAGMGAVALDRSGGSPQALASLDDLPIDSLLRHARTA